MTKNKHLDATGKEEYLYDFQNDILMVRIKDREYKLSIEFQNFVADIDEEGFVTGVRIFDASQVLDVDKYVLKSIVRVGFKARIERNVITIAVQFMSKIRNRVFPLIGHEEKIKQQITTPIDTPRMRDSLVECNAVI